MSSVGHRVAVSVAPGKHVARVSGVGDPFLADVTALDWIRGRGEVTVAVSDSDDSRADYTLFGIALDETTLSAGGLLVRVPAGAQALVAAKTYYVHMYS